MLITLNEEELKICKTFSEVKLRNWDKKGKRKQALMEKVEGRDPLELLYEGTCSDFAAAKYFKETPTVRVYTKKQYFTDRESRGNDVGAFHIKTTKYSDGCLILQKYDMKGRPYILVTGVSPGPYELVGWMWAKDAMKKEFERRVNNHVSYWVEQEFLRPMAKLHRLIEIMKAKYPACDGLLAAIEEHRQRELDKFIQNLEREGFAEARC